MTPTRTCVGCGRQAPRDQLERFVAPAGLLVHDPAGTAPGRGAYTCRDRRCFDRALARRAFARTLRRPVHVPVSEPPPFAEG